MNCTHCGKDITDTISDADDGSDMYICYKCHLQFNVQTTDLDKVDLWRFMKKKNGSKTN